jgi:phosphatidylserine/phosphatidylglycerophosphate/cardiolipin synthase-like enzyme
MKQRTRLAIACLTAALIAVTPLAFSQSFTDRLVDQMRGLVSPTSQPETLPPPAGQTIETGFSPEGGAEALVLRVIGSAHMSIRLAGYSFTSPKVVRALLDAKRRGIDVAVVVDDRSNRAKVSQQALNLLVNASIPTRTVNRYAIHHDKYVVVDDRHVETGSFNFTTSAARRNSENVLVVWNNPALAKRYSQHWESRFAQGIDYHSTY